MQQSGDIEELVVYKGEMKVKTAIVSTYCEWSSLGSMLQAQALQETLEAIGVESTVLRKNSYREIWPKIKLSDIKSPKHLLARILGYVNLPYTWKRAKKNEVYINKNIRNIAFDKYDDVFQKPPVADVYIAGSDQIWSPHLKRPDFFLQYVERGRKCISYAASMGNTVISEERAADYREMLKKFEGFSVRESDMVDILQGMTDAPIYHHIDPTLLKTASMWRKNSKEYKVERPYILVYPIYWRKELNEELKKLHRETGFDIISIQYGFRKVYCTKRIQIVDPGEFIWLVDHAQCVVTSSFHGVAFSIIFNKKFYAAINPQAPSRIRSLLDTLEIELPSIDKCYSEFNVDYKKVNELIAQEKERSISYLRSAIFDEAQCGDLQ